MTERAQKLMSSFRTRIDNGTYAVARILPRIGFPPAEPPPLRREPNVPVPQEARRQLLSEFTSDATKIGLELGARDKAVQLVRVAGIGFGENRHNPQLEQAYARMRIRDGKGNDVRFRIELEPDARDDQERDWQKVTVRLERAQIDGKRIKLTPEMRREGFTFLSHNMPEILAQAKNGEVVSTMIRQETPDAACFVDGHHASGGDTELGCHCKEERAESLTKIFAHGGISVLMPGTGNGNGSEAQAMQIAARNSATRRGRSLLSYPDVYRRMGKSEDGRDPSLAISTILLEHLFQIKDVPSLIVLTDSRRKKNVWNAYGSHDVVAQSLESTVRDGLDYEAKRRRGYQGSGAGSLPLR